MEAERFRRMVPEADVRISGVGVSETAVAVAKALRDGYSDLVLAGIAGSYDDAVAVGSTVAVREERPAGLPSDFSKNYSAVSIPKDMQAVVSNTVARSGAAAAGAQIENMEGAVFFAMCTDAGVRFCEVRSISNKVGEPRSEWQTDAALDALTRTLVEKFANKSFMDKNKVIIWTVVVLLVAALVGLIVWKWDEWFREPFMWAGVIILSFLTGWLVGRFLPRKSSKTDNTAK